MRSSDRRGQTVYEVHAANVPFAIIDLDGHGEKRIHYQTRYEDALYQRFLCALLPASSRIREILRGDYSVSIHGVVNFKAHVHAVGV
jgi:hypothetical protein